MIRGVGTASNAGHCVINVVNSQWSKTVYKVYGEQDKSGKQGKMSGNWLTISTPLVLNSHMYTDQQIY